MGGKALRTLAAFAAVLVCLPLYAVEPGAPPARNAKGAERSAAARYKADELLVKFREGVSDAQIEAVVRAHGAAPARKFQRPRQARAGAAIERWRHVRVPPGRELEGFAAQLRQHPAVERVEPNYEVRAQFTPDDPRFAEQWALHNIGQTGGAPDADIDATEAWDVTTGGDTLVAVIDTGVDAAHPELALNMWVNPGEVPGNGIDDDGNGFIDDVHGYDFASHDADPADDHGHGTHVAGIIAAVGNNAAGVAGVAWRARIMSVKFLAADGRGWIVDAVDAVLYATDMGARLMNNSWGGGGYSQALADAITAANEAGSLFVAAAGNNGSNNDFNPFYPAAYEMPNVVAVSASDKYDSRAWFTNVGARSVLLAAPGVEVLSSVPAAGNDCCIDPSGYRLLSGTSMAAPHVSGAAALLLAQDPTRTAFNLIPLLHQTVDWAPGGSLTRSDGRLNVNRALRCDAAGSLHLIIRTPEHGFVAFIGEPFGILAQVHGCGYPIAGASVTVSFTNGDAPIALFDDGAHGDGAANDGVYGGSWTPGTMSAQMAMNVTASEPARGSATLGRSGIVRRHVTYRFEPATYGWIDATGGTRPSFNFYGGASVPLGFSFEFYGQLYGTLFVDKAGYLSVFGPTSDFYSRTRLPDAARPNGLIAPYWGGLNATAESRVYVLAEGAAPERRLTVAWLNYRDLEGRPASFQATLYEGSSDIRFQYQQAPDRGIYASVGVEDQPGTEGTQYSFMTPALADAMAIRFYPGPFNRGPTANAGGPYTGLPAAPIAFDGSASSDPENDALTHRWDFGDGTTGSGARPSHTYAAKGTYTVTLTVNDGIHDSPPVTTTVTVLNRPPVAVLSGPSSGLRGSGLSFDASASHDPDGEAIYSHSWNFGDGTGTGMVGYAPTAGHVYNQTGTFTVTLVVNDRFADSAPATMTVTIANTPPIADAGPDVTAAPRSTVYLPSYSYDPDGQIVQYRWRQVAGPAVTLANATTSLASFTAPNAKSGSPITLEFELTVTDNDGAQASDRKIVTVVR